MGTIINSLSDLRNEKEKLKRESEDQLKHATNSLNSVQREGKLVLVNKILIPVGIALVAGYGVKKLVDYLNSEEEIPPQSIDAPQTRSSHSSGLLSRINWSGLAVQVVPFIISVGKKMYEDGQLPFFNPPHEGSEEGHSQ